MRHFKPHPFLILVVLAITTHISHGHDMIPGAKQDSPILLKNGTIHTITGATLVGGDLLFENGKITAVTQSIIPPEGSTVIDLTGKHIYPGLISAISSIGLIEINSVSATIDLGEGGELNPSLRPEVAVNPDSEVIPVTRANGVLFAHLNPSNRRGGLIAGQTALLNLDGWTTEDLTFRSPIGMKITWPPDPQVRGFEIDPSSVDDQKKAEENYAKKIKELEQAFADARAFWKAKNQGNKTLDVDLRWEAFEPVVKKAIPVLVNANSVRQIRDAVNWAQQEDLDLVLVGGADAWRVAEFLGENHIPVIIGNVNGPIRRRSESYDTPFKNSATLHKAGVTFAIAYNGGPHNERNLPYEAGRAVAFGLPREEAIKAITIYPAEILGVADRLGSLEVGKDASLIVTNGDPLDIRSIVELAFIEGRSVELSSRHTQLYEKYQIRYPQD
ncbi:MAG: amidohydrolase family protein [Verrucomicrobia bacterium]|nr:amidohydrolase family protein [Verrucomicrobiota bacterium]